MESPKSRLYAGRMIQDNQQGPPAGEVGPASPAWNDFEVPGFPPERSRIGRSLIGWLVALVAFGVGGVILGMGELALLMALTGMFVAAQAADVDPVIDPLYYAIAWVAPLSGAAAALAIDVQIYLHSPLPAPARAALVSSS